MGRTKVSASQAGFAGGLNSVGDPNFLRPDQMRQSINMRLSQIGAAMKRLGTGLTTSTPISTNDTTNGVCGGIFWPSKAKIYLMAGGSGSTTAITLWSTPYPAPFSATWTNVGALPQYRPVIFSDGTQEIMYVAGDNSTAVQKFDGTTISALGATTAKVAGLCVYNDRLWGWNGNTNTTLNSIYYSQLSSVSGSTGGDSLGLASAGGGQIVVRTFGMQTIVACAPVGASLLIFHQKGISRLTGWGQDDIQVLPQALTADVGMGRATASGICVYDNVAYFITDRGGYKATEGDVTPLSTPDKPDPLFGLLQAGTTDPSQVTVTFNRQYNEVWFTVAGIGVYVYNTILGAWSGPFTGTYASAFRAIFEVWEGLGNSPVGTPYGNSHLWIAQFNGSGGAGLLVSECDRAGVYKDTANGAVPSTTGTVVTATLQLHRLFGEDRTHANQWRWVNLLATLTAGATAPTASIGSQIGTANTVTFDTLVSASKPYYLPAGGMGPYLDCTITDTGSTGTSQYELATAEGYVLGQR